MSTRATENVRMHDLCTSHVQEFIFVKWAPAFLSFTVEGALLLREDNQV